MVKRLYPLQIFVNCELFEYFPLLVFVKCFKKTYGNLWILKSDEIIFGRTVAKNIYTAIPDSAFVNDGCTNGEFCIENDGYTLVQQSVGGTALFLCVKHNILSVCYQINESINYL